MTKIVSISTCCSPSSCLGEHLVSSPFDKIFVPLDKLNETLENNFEDFALLDNLVKCEFHVKPANETMRLLDTKIKSEIWYAFNGDTSIESQYYQFREWLDASIHSFQTLLSSGNKIIFIRHHNELEDIGMIISSLHLAKAKENYKRLISILKKLTNDFELKVVSKFNFFDDLKLENTEFYTVVNKDEIKSFYGEIRNQSI